MAGRLAAALHEPYLVLLGELEVDEPLVVPGALPELVAPALSLPVVPLPVVALPLEVWSFRHLILSALGRVSQRVLPVPAEEAPAPLEVVPLDVVPLDVVPVPVLLGSELPELVVPELVVPAPLSPVLVLELVLGELELVLGAVVVALGLVLVDPEPLTPLLLEAPAPVVPALLEVPVPMVLLLEAPVLDLLVAPEPLSDAQPAPKATSAAAVAAANSFIFIASPSGLGMRARRAPGFSKTHASRWNKPCAVRRMRANWKLAAGCAALLAAGVSAHLRTRRALRAHPPLGSFVETHGLRLHYIEKGQGPALILLHGLGSMVEDFVSSGLLDRLAASHRVIAFDRPGYGHSDPAPRSFAWPWRQAELLREALHKLNVRHPTVLGHSWGSLVALAFALRYPGAVRGVALVSGYFFPTLRLDAPLLAPPGIPLLGDVLRFSISPWLGRALWPVFLRAIFGPARPPRHGPVPTWLALRPAQLKAVGAECLMTLPAAFALSRRYQELMAPMCIVAGAQDRYVSPRAHSMKLNRMLPQSRLLLVPGAGHMVHHTHGGEVVCALEGLRMPAVA